MQSGARVRPACPKCGSTVEKVEVFGQRSYSCSNCKSWGPWKQRRVISLAKESRKMICTNCKKPNCEDGQDTCTECAIYLQDIEAEEHPNVQVTKEMAIDAGDRRLEGQWIRW